MNFCDITMAYNEVSGGIRTYIDEKRRYILNHTAHHHLLVIPGENDAVERGERTTTISIASPRLPAQSAYRFFLRADKITRALLREKPDIIELGSYYVAPWACFAYRDRLGEDGHSCLIGCYFHTDVAEAYVGAPLRAISYDWLEPHNNTLSALTELLANLAETGAERYIASVFERCDLAIAPSPSQAKRLTEYGVAPVEVVPLGVDLELFNPANRSEEIRAELGARPENLVLVYAGRLSGEKRVLVLAEALRQLPSELGATLWILGEGPLKDELQDLAARLPPLRILSYCSDRQRFAAILASADLYVTAGPYETFGLAVIEAQASGLPVVGVDAGALRERVPEGLGLLGPVDDPNTMAENIVRLARERQAAGRRARDHVERNFGWNSAFGKLFDLYGTKLKQMRLPLPSMTEAGG